MVAESNGTNLHIFRRIADGETERNGEEQYSLSVETGGVDEGEGEVSRTDRGEWVEQTLDGEVEETVLGDGLHDRGESGYRQALAGGRAAEFIGAFLDHQVEVAIVGDIVLIGAGDSLSGGRNDTGHVDLQSRYSKTRPGDGKGIYRGVQSIQWVISAANGDSLAGRGDDGTGGGAGDAGGGAGGRT